MSVLTTQQQSIIDSLVKEFTSINEVPVKKGGLINVGLIHQEVQDLKVFNETCKAEKKAFARKIHFQIVADIEKITPDLDALGLKIKPFESNLCQSSIIIENGSIDYLYIGYNTNKSIKRECQGHINMIGKSIKLTVNLKVKGGYSHNCTHNFHNIESLCSSSAFRDRLKELIKS